MPALGCLPVPRPRRQSRVKEDHHLDTTPTGGRHAHVDHPPLQRRDAGTSTPPTTTRTSTPTAAAGCGPARAEPHLPDERTAVVVAVGRGGGAAPLHAARCLRPSDRAAADPSLAASRPRGRTPGPADARPRPADAPAPRWLRHGPSAADRRGTPSAPPRQPRPTRRPVACPDNGRMPSTRTDPGGELAVRPGPGVPQGLVLPAADLVERFSRVVGPWRSGGQHDRQPR